MAETVTVVNVTSGHFSDLFTAVNSLIAKLGTDVVTANNSVNGGLTTGNAYVAGSLGAITLAANNLQGGTINIAAPLAVTSNLVVNGSFSLLVDSISKMNSTGIYVGANVGANTGTIFTPSFISGANVSINTTAFYAGNSLVNTTAFYTGNSLSSILITPTTITIGNSTVNNVLNASAFTVNIQSLSFGDATNNLVANSSLLKIASFAGGTANLTPTSLKVGGSTVDGGSYSVGNTVVNSTIITLGNSTINTTANNSTVSTGQFIAGNTVVNSTIFTIGNSTVNTVVNSTVLTLGNTVVNSTIFTIGNSTVNVFANSTVLALGNSSVNTTVNSSTITTGTLKVSGTTLVIGNATVNLVTNSTSVKFSDGTLQSTAPVFFASGTKLVFPQASVPTGWTLDATHNDKALRIVNGTGGGTGGSLAFSTAFSRTATDTHALSIAEMPSHTHVISQIRNNDGAGTAGVAGIGTIAGGSYATDSAGSGTAHSHTMDIRVQYVDTVIGIKS